MCVILDLFKTCTIYHCIRLLKSSSWRQPTEGVSPFMTSSYRGVSPFYDVSPQKGYPLLWRHLTEGVFPYHDAIPQRGYPTFMTASQKGGIPLLWQHPTKGVSPYHDIIPPRGFPFSWRRHLTPLFRCSHFSQWSTFTLHLGSNFLELLLAAILNNWKGGAMRKIWNAIYYCCVRVKGCCSFNFSHIPTVLKESTFQSKLLTLLGLQFHQEMLLGAKNTLLMWMPSRREVFHLDCLPRKTRT